MHGDRSATGAAQFGHRASVIWMGMGQDNQREVSAADGCRQLGRVVCWINDQCV